MNIKKYTFDTDIQILNIGDLHRGDNACDVSLFYDCIDYITRNKNCYWISTGDILNTAIRNGKHASIYGSVKLEDEYEYCMDEFRQISDKCLGVVSSNHHLRVFNAIGMSLDKLFCRELNVPYLGDMGLINIVCDKNSYYAALFHGCGAGATIGAKANGLEKLSQVFPCADLYLTGHTHTYQSFISEVPYIDRKRTKLSYFQSYFCTTGHFLNWNESYAPQLGLKPSPKGAAHIEFHASPCGNKKKVRIDLFN